jgi:hypothetical protein
VYVRKRGVRKWMERERERDIQTMPGEIDR